MWRRQAMTDLCNFDKKNGPKNSISQLKVSSHPADILLTFLFHADWAIFQLSSINQSSLL
jgi:hypothetical protein